MRNLFIDIIVKEARLNEKIVLIVGDLGFNVVEPFKKEFPNILQSIRFSLIKRLVLGLLIKEI